MKMTDKMRNDPSLIDQSPSGWTAGDLKSGIEAGLRDHDEGRYREFDESGFRHFINELKARLNKQ